MSCFIYTLTFASWWLSLVFVLRAFLPFHSLNSEQCQNSVLMYQQCIVRSSLPLIFVYFHKE